MQRLVAAALAAAVLIPVPGPSTAQDVRLTSRDGSVEIDGTLLSFDGEYYRLDTVYGILTLDGSGVTCAGPSCPDPEAFVPDFLISGAAETGAVLIPSLLEAFAERDGYAFARQEEDASHFTYVLSDATTGAVAARARFRVTSSDEGFADLLAEQADIVLSFREVSQAELERAQEAGLGDLSRPARSRVAALDGIVAVVAPDNALQSITLPQVAQVLSGEIANWRALGGPDAEIQLHLRNPRSGLSQSLRDAILGANGPSVRLDATRYRTTAELADAVSTDPFAFGIATYSERGSARALALAGSCGTLTRATATALQAEDYPLTAPHFIYTPARRIPRIAREFLAFIQSPEAQPVIRELGFVDQTLTSIPLARQGDRLAKAVLNAGQEIGLRELRRMVSALNEAARLTMSFRFEGGSSELDAQSRANISLLAEAVNRGRFDGRTLIFAGFSDGRGGAASNRDLSRRRAEAVRDAVLALVDADAAEAVTFDTDGFGEALPMACDNDGWGQRVNRRVEIWLR